MMLLFEQKIRLGFSLALVLLLILGGIGWWSAAHSISGFHGVDQTHQILDELDSVSIGILNAETAARGYAFTGNELYLKPYQSGVETVGKSRDELQQLLGDNVSLKGKLEMLGVLLDRKLAAVGATIQERKVHGLDAASKMLATGEGDALMEQIRNS